MFLNTGVAAYNSDSRFLTISQFEYVQAKVFRLALPKSLENSNSYIAKRSFHEERTLDQVLPDDTFHMQITAFNQSFSLFLEPNYDLIHPNAVVRVRQKDGTFKTSPLKIDDVGVYRGYVLSAQDAKYGQVDKIPGPLYTRSDFTFDDKASGARVTLIKDDDGNTGMDGTFFYRGETYNLKFTDSYRKVKRSDDPALYARDDLPKHLRSVKTLIYRRSDTFEMAEEAAPPHSGVKF